VFTQKFPSFSQFNGHVGQQAPFHPLLSRFASPRATSRPLIGSSVCSRSIDCRCTWADCLQCFSHSSISEQRGGGVSSKQRELCVPLSLWKWYKSAAHTALINGLRGQLNIHVPSRILLASPWESRLQQSITVNSHVKLWMIRLSSCVEERISKSFLLKLCYFELLHRYSRSVRWGTWGQGEEAGVLFQLPARLS